MVLTKPSEEVLKSMKSRMKKRIFPLSEVYRLREPGSVVLVTTARAGRANHVKGRVPHVASIMPMSWHLMMEFVPPLVGCVISNRNYSFETLKLTKECIINIPTVEPAEQLLERILKQSKQP